MHEPYYFGRAPGASRLALLTGVNRPAATLQPSTAHCHRLYVSCLAPSTGGYHAKSKFVFFVSILFVLQDQSTLPRCRATAVNWDIIHVIVYRKIFIFDTSFIWLKAFRMDLYTQVLLTAAEYGPFQGALGNIGRSSTFHDGRLGLFSFAVAFCRKGSNFGLLSNVATSSRWCHALWLYYHCFFLSFLFLVEAGSFYSWLSVYYLGYQQGLVFFSLFLYKYASSYGAEREHHRYFSSDQSLFPSTTLWLIGIPKKSGIYLYIYIYTHTDTIHFFPINNA